MLAIPARAAHSLLRLLGARSLRMQFFLSYGLIFLCAAVTAGVLVTANQDASQIDRAGAQRMLSQKMMGEAVLAAQGTLPASAVDATIAQFERSHRLLLDGDDANGISAVAHPEARNTLLRVDTLWQRYRAEVQAVASGQNKDFARLAADAATVLSTANTVVTIMSRHANETNARHIWIALGSTGTILILVLFGSVGMSWLMGQIDTLRARLERVGRGDFSQPMVSLYDDNELGRITLAYNQLLRQVGDMIHAVRHAAGSAESQGTLMHRSARDSAAGVESQQADVDRIATAMNQMASSAQEVARSTEEAAAAADTAEAETRQGSAVMTESVNAIRTLSADVEGLSDLMDRLVADSLEIGKVLGVIEGIAAQTNLLALNAAIEAARAGEEGAGFSVVADEVRHLAARTQSSAKEVGTLIQRLQDQATRAGMAMASSRDSSTNTLTQIETAQEALHRIVGAVGTIRDMTTQIATAAEEQSRVAEDMSGSLARVATVAEQAAAATDETARSSGTIMEQMEALTTLTARFQLLRQDGSPA